jgi:hypothetical protein
MAGTQWGSVRPCVLGKTEGIAKSDQIRANATTSSTVLQINHLNYVIMLHLTTSIVDQFIR